MSVRYHRRPTMSTLISYLSDASRPAASAWPALSWPRVDSLRAVDFLLLAFVCWAWFFVGLGSGELWRTEGLRALVAQGMLDSGDWIVPRLYGEPHFTKPPGFYLAVVLCSLPGGVVTELTARLPSALAATACVCLFCWYFGRRLGRAAGLAAGLILPVSALWLDKASAAEIDMLQVAWVTASILFFLRATEDDAGSAWGWWLASFTCVAGGFLTKWTAPQFFYCMAVPYLALQGRLGLLCRAPHLIAAALAVLVAGTWIVVAVERTGSELFVATLLQEFRPRFLPAYYEQPFSVGGALFLPVKLFSALLPSSIPALLALRPAFARTLAPNARQLLVAMHCWAWPSIGLWMLANEHTPRHSFPALPAIAGMAALVWHAWHSGRLGLRFARVNPGQFLVGVCALWLLVKLAFVTVVVPQRAAERQARARAAQLDELVPAGATLCHCFWNRNESLLFYYGRPARRLAHPGDVDAGHLLLARSQWLAWADGPDVEPLAQLRDEKGDELVLLELPRRRDTAAE